MKTNREQIEKIVEHAGKRKINLPADLLLSIAKSDAQELVDTLEKVPEFWEADKITGIISPAHLPLYTKTTSGIVPPPKEDGLVLMSDGWHFPPVVTNITSVTGGTRGGGGGGGVTDHALLTNLAYATSGHTGFQPTLAFPLVPNLGGTGVANLAASTLTLGAATTITGGGIIGLGGFTGTVSITGTFAMGAGTLTAVTVNDVTVAAHTHAITGFQPTMTFPLAANLGGTGVANLVASTLTLGAATSITGGGTIGLGGFTLTVPATGTAALLATQNVFTTNQKINCNSTTALFVEQDGVNDNTFIVDTTNAIIGINSAVATNILINANKIFTDGTVGSQGINLVTTINSNANTTTGIWGAQLTTQAQGSGGATTGNLHGIVSYVYNQQTAGTWLGCTGIRSDIQNTNASVITNGAGFQSSFRVSGAGNITTVSEFLAKAPTISAAGAIVTHYGYYAENLGQALTTSSYALYILGQSGSITNNYAIYTNAGLNRLGDQLMVQGSADRTQLRTVANGTQTTNLATWETSVGGVMTAISGTGEWGIGVAPSTLRAVGITKTFTSPATQAIGINTTVNIAPTAGADANTHAGQVVTLNLNTTNTITGGYGIGGFAYNNGANLVTNLYGLAFGVGALGAGGVTNAHVIEVQVYSTGAGVLSNLSGVYVRNLGVATTAVTLKAIDIAAQNTAVGTNKYGIYINDISGAGTGNYAILTYAGNIVFNEGGDTNTDFRVESDTYNAINIDASADSIVIMSNTAGKVGFWGHAAAVQPSAYTPSNVVADRSYDANSTTLDEIADVLGTLIADLQSVGLVG